LTHNFKYYPEGKKYFTITIRGSSRGSSISIFPKRVNKETFKNVKFYTLDVEKMEIIMRINNNNVKRSFFTIKTDPNDYREDDSQNDTPVKKTKK
jgi:hypothetical protein